ncbi:hypothetical protein E4U41_002073 [Claviceps citrina]|nr:hypothetical protein E4U41_002073 [Claviceps citrina]
MAASHNGVASGPRLIGRAARDDVPDMDVLSRSVPTSGPLLEPEPASLAMLPDQRQHDQQGHDGHQYHDQHDRHGRHAAPSEQSPLLRPRAPSPSSTRSTHSLGEPDAAPFLNGTSTGRFWAIFSQILMVQFIGCFDGTIMASSHPVITSYFGAANSASWLSTAFLLASTAFQPLLGRLSDALGRKPLFVASLAVFTGATAWCAAAGSIEAFVVARAFCGLGAGGCMTLGSIITSDLVPIECVPLSGSSLGPLGGSGQRQVANHDADAAARTSPT